MLLLHRRTSAQTQSSQHWTCEEEKMSILTWKTSANHANISTSNREVYCRAFPTNNHKRQKQNWSNTIHIKNANKKTKMIHPQAHTKTKQRWSHHKSQAKAIAKKNMISPPITDKDCLVEDCSVWAQERHWIECRVCTLREIILCDF